MRILTLVLIFTATSSFAKDNRIEKSKFDLDKKQKLALCQDLADERFCGSEVDARRCIDDFEFSGQIKHLAGKPKTVVKKSYKLKSKDHDFEFTKVENYDVDFRGGEFKTRYAYESYSTEGRDSSGYVPSFVVDSSCKGDGDND